MDATSDTVLGLCHHTCSVLVLGYRCKKSVIVLLNTWIAHCGIESNLSLQWWRRGQCIFHIAQLSQRILNNSQCILHTVHCTVHDGYQYQRWWPRGHSGQLSNVHFEQLAVHIPQCIQQNKI